MSSMRAAANSGLWRSVTERGSHPTGSVTGCAARHEARHSPRLRLAPACSQPRPRPGVAELGVVRPRYPSPVNEALPTNPKTMTPRAFATVLSRVLGLWLAIEAAFRISEMVLWAWSLHGGPASSGWTSYPPLETITTNIDLGT